MPRTRVTILSLIVPACLVAAVLPVATAAASPGPGTFTRITTPNKDVTFHFKIGQANHIHVVGQTSLDVTSVDIDCITAIYNGPADIQPLATSVPVSSGEFSVTGTLPSSPGATCRLRAIPSGTDVSGGDYFSAYTGPILFIDAFGLTKSGTTAYSFTATAGERDGIGIIVDAGTCGVEALIPVDIAGPQVGPVVVACGTGLPSNNITSGTPSGSTIKVDGHNAYLPSGVHQFLIGDRSLPVTQSAMTASEKVAANGDVTITESAVLMRCTVADTYPPTTTSCPHLTSTGVKFGRVTKVFRDGQQATTRDTYTSTDHRAHALKLQYLGEVQNESGASTATGRVGYIFPGHGHTFAAANNGKVVTGLGTKAGTMLIRSDLYANSDDPATETIADTWSRGPSKIQYAVGAPDTWGMSYSLSVPSGHSVSLGFASSVRLSTAATVKLGGLAEHDMLPTLTAAGTSDNSKGQAHASGKITAGANGLPVTVTVNGHPAKVTPTSATTATFSLSFHLPSSTHTIKIVVTDAAGNKATASFKG